MAWKAKRTLQRLKSLLSLGLVILLIWNLSQLSQAQEQKDRDRPCPGELPAVQSLSQEGPEKIAEHLQVVRYEKIDPTSLSQEEQAKLHKELNAINGEIQVGGEEKKTWRVYTKPILKRKNLYVARNHQGEVVGYAAMRDEEAYLSWVAVKREYRGKDRGGVAKKLLENILSDYLHFSLDVRKSNLPAIKFYGSLQDVAEVAITPGHVYANGDEGLIYQFKRK